MTRMLLDGRGRIADVPPIVWRRSVLPLARRRGQPVLVGHWWTFPDGRRVPHVAGAASTIEAKYGTNNQSITCTLTSLANASGAYGAGRASTAVDNTSNLFLDAGVFLKIKTSSSALANDKTIYVYAYGTSDGGTTYTDGATGTDAALTGTNPPNMNRIGSINAVATSSTYEDGPFSVASAFGGILPDHWGIYVVNYTGQSLDATTASAWYQGAQAQGT